MSMSIGDPRVKKQPERPVLITDAARSQGDQLRSREVRYVIMMGLRVSCLILGAILISVKPPLLPLWLILCAAGMVFLPWAAVLIANDRPPRTRAERASTPQPTTDRELADRERQLADRETPTNRTIDPDQ
jgi:hypothetical protein